MYRQIIINDIVSLSPEIIKQRQEEIALFKAELETITKLYSDIAKTSRNQFGNYGHLSEAQEQDLHMAQERCAKKYGIV